MFRLRQRLSWALEPVPWRGMLVVALSFAVIACGMAVSSAIDGAIGRYVDAAMFWVGFAGMAVGVAGHFRWFAKRGREGKIGFRDE